MPSLNSDVELRGNVATEQRAGLAEVSDCQVLARYLHVDLEMVQGLAQRGEIPCRKVGKAYKVLQASGSRLVAWCRRPRAARVAMSVRRRVQRLPSAHTSTRWVVDVQFRQSNGRVERVRETPRVQSRVGAERLEREILRRLEMGTKAAAPPAPTKAVPSLAAFWKTFLTTHVAVNNKPSEQATKTRIMRLYLLPRFGRMKLDAIGPAAIDTYKADMTRDGYSAKTINNRLTVLRTVLMVAQRWEVLAADPRITLTRHRPPDMRFLSFDEAPPLVAAADGQWPVMVLLALNTGMRIGELIALRWDDLDLVVGRLRVRHSAWLGVVDLPKSGRERGIPLNKSSLSALVDGFHEREGLVFCDEKGDLLTYRRCNYALERICRSAALPSVQWHALRHTFASHLVMRGMPLKAIQERLGHSSRAMTERYAHLTPNVRRDAVHVLNQPEA